MKILSAVICTLVIATLTLVMVLMLQFSAILYALWFS